LNPVHQDLAGGRWQTFSLCAQMAHIGSEVERALNWGRKGNPGYREKAFHRALELIGLTLRDPRHQGRRREIARVREGLVDFFACDNAYRSTEENWRNYFRAFAYAARLGR
jgi:hypothetical protein